VRDELKVFFTDHNFHLSDEFLTRLKYLDVFSRLNDLNLGLQGLSATIFNVRDKIEAMIKKLELFSVCINKDNTQVFP
jgi:predicted DNA-binding protein